ncbi:calpain-15-like isoform X2 [Oscarella lobularis]|uniref:calpain-15-like isoform X2 n=1 Tax=Oscarella lobularis TaxID=121494 RepID=UPI003314237E
MTPRKALERRMAETGTWQCSECTTTNSVLMARCHACKTPRKGSWKCGRCTLENGYDCERCSACQVKRTLSFRSQSPSPIEKFTQWISKPFRGKQRLPESEIAPKRANKRREESHGWSCPICTFSNDDAENFVCKMCGESNPWKIGSVDLVPSNESKSWSCPKCTMKNPPSRDRCEVCGCEAKGGAIEVDSRWSCQACTFLNSVEAKQCRVCRANRDQVEIESRHRFTLGRQESTCVDVRRQRDEENALRLWNDIVAFCKSNRLPFVDPMFPPCPKSLYLEPRHSDNPRVACWLRPQHIRQKELIRSSWVVFSTPKPSDIIQGIVGNCWFLSALAVLAEKPKLLQNIIITKNICQEGAYQVRLCRNGIWEVVLIDDVLPCNNYGMLVYSQANRGQLWVPLIEKALAKQLGCYEAMKGGACIEGLSLLTGAPCEKIRLQTNPNRPDDALDSDLIWARLLSVKDAGFLMGASCGSSNNSISEEEFRHVGLVSQHAYSVLDVQQVPQGRLIQLRNPWGSHSWRGDWGDASPLWTAELRKKLHARKTAKEGVFWIALKDLMKYFDRVDVCKVRPDWCETRIDTSLQSDGRGPTRVARIRVLADTEIDACLYQPHNRHFDAADSSIDLCVAILAVPPVGQVPTSAVSHSQRAVKACVTCSAFLREGDYLVVPMAFNHFNSTVEQKPCLLAIHTARPIEVDSFVPQSTLLSSSVYLMLTKSGKRSEVKFIYTCCSPA